MLPQAAERIAFPMEFAGPARQSGAGPDAPAGKIPGAIFRIYPRRPPPGYFPGAIKIFPRVDKMQATRQSGVRIPFAQKMNCFSECPLPGVGRICPAAL